MKKHVIVNRDCPIWGLAHLRDKVRRMCLSLYVKQSIVAILGIVLVLCHPSPLVGEDKVRGDFFKGYTYMQESKFDLAIEEFKTAIEGNPTHGPSYSNLALCLERLEKYDEAIEIWERYKGLSPLYEDRIKNHINMVQEMKRIKGTVPTNIIPILENITKDTYPGSGIRLHALRLLGSHYFTNKQYKDCIRVYQSLMADYSKELTEDILLEYAQSLQEEEKFLQAVETYKKIPNPSSDIQYRVLICLSEAGQDKEVISMSNNLLKETVPDLRTEQSRTGVPPVKVESGLSIDMRIEILYRRGIAYKRLGKLDDAIKEFTKLTQDYPESNRIPDSIYETGICYQKNGDNKKALEEFKKLFQKVPENERQKYPEALYYITEEKYNTNPKDYTPIIKQLDEAIILSPKTELASKSQYLLMKVYNQIGEYAKRDQAYLQYINNYPKYYKPDEVAKIGIQLGDGYFKAERYNEALAIYNLILTKFPNTKPVNEAKVKIAQCLEKIGRTKEALTLYSQLKEKEDLEGEILESIADIYAKEGNLNKALENYEKAGSSYRKESKYDEAIKIYEKIIKTTPNPEQSLNAQLMLALSLVGKKEFEKGINQMKAIIARYPNHEVAAKSQYLIAYSYLTHQKYAEALIEYEKLITKYPKNTYAIQSKELVEKLKGAVSKTKKTPAKK